MKALVRTIQFGSSEYEKEKRLRDEVLWRPLGLHITKEYTAGESTHHHIGAFMGDTLAGCLVLAPKDSKKIQMKQVAVRPDMQGAGIGRDMLVFAEQLAAGLGFEAIFANAQKHVEEFYIKSGYTAIGDEFIEVGIPHIIVKKKLTESL